MVETKRSVASGLSMTHKKETMLMLVNSLTKDGGHPKHMHNYQEGCKNAFFYIKINAFLLSAWMHIRFTLCMLGTFLVHALLLSVFLTIF